MILGRTDFTPLLGSQHLHPRTQPPPRRPVGLDRVLELPHGLTLLSRRRHRQNGIQRRCRLVQLPRLLQFLRFGQPLGTLSGFLLGQPIHLGFTGRCQLFLQRFKAAGVSGRVVSISSVSQQCLGRLQLLVGLVEPRVVQMINRGLKWFDPRTRWRRRLRLSIGNVHVGSRSTRSRGGSGIRRRFLATTARQHRQQAHDHPGGQQPVTSDRRERRHQEAPASCLSCPRQA